MTNDNDAALLFLVRKAIAGHADAKESLIELCRERLTPLAYGFALCGEPKDLLQEALNRISQNLSRYDETKAGFWAWAYTVALRRILSKLKIPYDVYKDIRKVRDAHDRFVDETDQVPCDDDLAHRTGLTPRRVRYLWNRYVLVFTLSLEECASNGGPVAVAPQDVTGEIERMERFDALLRAIRQLPDIYRRVINLHYFGGIKLCSRDPRVRTVATILKVSSANARKLAENGRKRLAVLLSEYAPEVA